MTWPPEYGARHLKAVGDSGALCGMSAAPVRVLTWPAWKGYYGARCRTCFSRLLDGKYAIRDGNLWACGARNKRHTRMDGDPWVGKDRQFGGNDGGEIKRDVAKTDATVIKGFRHQACQG